MNRNLFKVGQELAITQGFIKFIADKWHWNEEWIGYLRMADHLVVTGIGSAGVIVEMDDGVYVGGISFDWAEKLIPTR